MKQETIVKKARQVLSNNKEYQEAVERYKETAKDLTHWPEPETTEELIKVVGENVVMSNEGCVSLTDFMYTTELLYGLREEFEKASLFVESYDGGTFHITEVKKK